MEKQLKIQITDPSGELPLIDFGRHFAVEGTFCGTLPENPTLTVKLFDSDGNLVRFVRQDIIGNCKIYTDHPDLTKYPPQMDSDLSHLRKFGFPPLMVKDESAPEKSLRDATIKCYFTRDNFKCIIVSATDTEHGLYLPDGMEYTDENGRKYTALPRGKYTIRAELSADGTVYANAEKGIEIGDIKDRIICRFNPRSHKERMKEWCRERGFSVITDLMPGYLDSYMGTWLYHMGLLKMYRACDVAMYVYPKIHMFIYNITPDSTSYETEIGFMQVRERIGNPDSFKAYCYDIGEAKVGEKSGEIIEFGKDEYLKICRIDTISPEGKENLYDLSGEGVREHHFAPFALNGEKKFAVMGVIKPWQMSPSDFRLKDDNTYEMLNYPARIEYTFRTDGYEESHSRVPGLERIDKGSIGTSVFEFYNTFSLGEEFFKKRVNLRIAVYDAHGRKSPAEAELEIDMI